MKSIFSVLVFSIVIFNSSIALAHNPEALKPLSKITLTDGREVVADNLGRVVYTFDPDAPNTSTCYDGCARTWPPVMVASADGLIEPMGVAERKTGGLQLTLEGQPLYYFKGDKRPGDILGDGLGNVWHIIVD